MATARKRLDQQEIDELGRTTGWTADAGTLEKTFAFGAYRDGVAFGVAIAMAAEARDHHPDIVIGYGRVMVRWSTHDAGGITQLDAEMAKLSDEIAARHGST